MAKRVKIHDIRQWQSLRNQGFDYNEVGSQTGWNPATVRKRLTAISFRPEAWFVASAFDDLSLFPDIARRHKLLKELLSVEKRRRGIDNDRIAFLGIANVAEYFYCAMQSVFKSREEESMFFLSYLQDRMNYTKLLKRPEEPPITPEALLDIGKGISIDDIQGLLDVISKIRPATGDYVTDFSVSAPTNSPLSRGVHLHRVKAERYPTIRWNFESNGYVLVGIPDGITSEFVYEFKSSQNPFLMSFLKPVALAQADLYGYFFRREKKRVQLYIVESPTLDTIESPIDNEKVERVLQEFRQIEGGWNPQPPREWKCKKCRFRDICTIKVN